jgi:diguanylate cyclase (GGDEF)-like protein/PAS domain S-box-containing protein
MSNPTPATPQGKRVNWRLSSVVAALRRELPCHTDSTVSALPDAASGTARPPPADAPGPCDADEGRQELRRLAQLRAAYRDAHDAVLLIDVAQRTVVDASPSAVRLLGGSRQTLRQKRIDAIHDEDPDRLLGLFDEVVRQGQGRVLGLNYRTRDGRSIPADVSLSPLRGDDAGLLLCIARTDRGRDRDNRRIEHLAYHDTLTGLPNRALLTDRVTHALARARRTSRSGALLFLDLDKFKRINDSLGHAVGDALLKELAGRLRQTLREEDTIARLGGDEFVVLLESLGEQPTEADAMAHEIAEKLRQSFNRPFVLRGHELYVTSSIGIVTFPRDGDDVDTLLRHADTAMYHAKGAGRDAARLFERRMDEVAMSRLRYEQDLRKGLAEGQFALYFQPVQTIREGRPLGAEALLRWNHPEHGLIAPSEFLPYIENSALMLRLGRWVLEETCRILGALQADPELDAPNCIGINIGHQQFEQPDFVDQVRKTLERTGADPQRLQIEITETLLIRDDKAAIERMHALRQLGVRFALDDFGTGYSSLSDLRRLPIETLKIDRSLIRDIASDAHDQAIVRAILSMAQHIGLAVVAEGVETREQLALLRDARCTYYQGFLGRPPVSLPAFREELIFRSREMRLFGQTAPRDPAPTACGY